MSFRPALEPLEDRANPAMGDLAGSSSLGRAPIHLRRRWTRVSSILLLGLAIARALPGHADETALEDPTHLVFSGALEVGVYGYSAKGNTRGSPITGPRTTPIPTVDLGPNIVDDLRSRDDVFAALIGGTFELMSPRLTAAVGQPRMFVDVNISAPLALEVRLARSGNPGPMALPETTLGGTTIGEAAIVGRGSVITVQPQGPQINAGIGTAFAIDVGEQEVLRIKPSLVYTRTILDVTAATNRAIRLPSPPPGPVDIDTHFRLVELSDNFTEVYHAMGPALELEYEPGKRIGPFAITLYIKGHASRIMGDLKTKMVGTNPDPSSPNETVHWKYTQDAWAYRASTGIRLRWDPRRGR